MTLKEKFTTMVLDKDIADWEKVCEKIADDYAIEFLEFHIGLLTKYVDDKWYFDYDAKWLDTKQLLLIFKKEKGL